MGKLAGGGGTAEGLIDLFNKLENLIPIDKCLNDINNDTPSLIFSFREAFCSVGYSPVMVFNVPDLQTSLTRMLALGAQMDGAVQYSLDGSKVKKFSFCFQFPK